MLKTLSVITAPPTSSATSRPNMVTIGARLARRPWAKITRRSERPLARAVRMKSSPERVEQAAADHPRIGRRVEQREHDPGQDQVRGPLPRRVGEGDIARAGRDVRLVPEEEQRHQAEPEDGRGDAEEREAHGDAIEDGAALDRRDDADGDPEQRARSRRRR